MSVTKWVKWPGDEAITVRELSNLILEAPRPNATEELEAGWWDATMDATYWWDEPSVSALQAAVLLAGANPTNIGKGVADAEETTHADGMGPDDFQKLRNTLKNLDDKKRTFSEWIAIVQQKPLRYHRWVDKWLDATRRQPCLSVVAKATPETEAPVLGIPAPTSHAAPLEVVKIEPIGSAARGPAPAPATIPDRSTRPPLPLKKSALVGLHKANWPTLESDLASAKANGLAEAAKADTRGWREKDALEWARSKGKLNAASKPGDLGSVMKGFGRQVQGLQG